MPRDAVSRTANVGMLCLLLWIRTLLSILCNQAGLCNAQSIPFGDKINSRNISIIFRRFEAKNNIYEKENVIELFFISIEICLNRKIVCLNSFFLNSKCLQQFFLSDFKIL